MSKSENIRSVEQQIADAETLIARRDLAIKLSENHEFRKLILEDFCTTEAARLVQLSADPALDPLQRADSLNMAQASGHLRRYLSMMIRMGNQAEDGIVEAREVLEELRAEPDDEEA